MTFNSNAVVQYPSVSEIENSRSPNSGIFTVGQLLGYGAPGDFGDSPIWWDATSTLDRDGILTFASADKPDRGRWRRILRDNVLSMGMGGAFQSGLTSLQATLAAQFTLGALGPAVSAKVSWPTSTFAFTRNSSQDDNATFTPTGNVSINSNVVRNVSSFTGVVIGKAITATGLGTVNFITGFNASARTITVSVPSTASATAATLTIGGTALDFGLVYPPNMNLTVDQGECYFDYQGSEASAGRGTCGIGYYNNQGGTTFWKASLSIRGGKVQPTAVGTNSDFMWINQRGSKVTIKGMVHGQLGAVPTATPLNPALLTGHRHFIVSARWNAAQNAGVSGQRIHIDDCDWVACTSSGVIITECDALYIGTGCSTRFCGLHGIELGASAKSFGGILQSGTCSAAQIRGNHQSHFGSGVKCFRAIGTTVKADFENNALGRVGLDANIDFTGSTFYNASLTGTTNSGNKIINALSGDPTALGITTGMTIYMQGVPVIPPTTLNGVSSTQFNTNTNSVSSGAGRAITIFGFPAGSVGDQAGRSEGSTFSNSDGTMQSVNIMTQDGCILQGNIHKGVTSSEIGIFHIGADQPLLAATEVFQGTVMTPFYSNNNTGGVVTDPGGVTWSTGPGVISVSNGSALANGTQLGVPFTLDAQSVLVTGAGVTNSGSPSGSTLQIQIFNASGGAAIATLFSSTTDSWVGGAFQHTTNNGYPLRQILNITQHTDPAWAPTNKYVIAIINTSGGTLSAVAGGVTLHFNRMAPT